MSEDNLQVSRRILEEAFGQGQLALIDEFVAADAVDHDPANPEDVRGPAGLKQQISMYRAAFPDLQFKIEDTISQDDRVVIRWSSRGTHRGELMGLAPTGKVVSVTGISIDRFADGKIVESWTNWDVLGLMRQLGAAPPPGSVGEKVGIQLQRLTARRSRQKAGTR
jgi:steroid delta-isomerase-like uncharacterized protein